MAGKHKAVWCDRGWMPMYYGFCPSRRAWDAEMKRLKVKDEPYPTSDGKTTVLDWGSKRVALVTIAEHLDRRNDRLGIVCLIAHEAAHVWQYIRKDIGEKEPSVEFEAYALQNIVMGLCLGYSQTRKRLY